MHRYLVALGSNVRHARHGPPQRVIAAALRALGQAPLHLVAASPVLASAPLGPSLRRYANATALVDSPDDPEAMLARLKAMERHFGRRPRGRRWGARVLDLDLVLWHGGTWTSPRLTIPHPAFRERDFVLRPALALTPHWRDPISGLTVRQLHGRLTQPRPLPIRHPSAATRSGVTGP